MKKKLSFLAASVMVVVVGLATWFAGTQTACHNLVDPRLKDGVGKESGAIHSWVNNNYLLGRLSQSAERPEELNEVNWYSLYNRYRAVSNQAVQAIYQYWRFRQVSVKDVLRCMGEPDAYSGAWAFPADAYKFHFSLWYPEHGYVFSTLAYRSPSDSPTIGLNTPLYFLGVVQPGSPEDMARNVFPAEDWGEEIYMESAATMQAWPSDFELIELERSEYVP